MALTKSDLNQIGNVIEDKLKPVKKDLTDVGKRVRKIEKTVDLVIDTFDRDIIGLRKRTDRIEQHLRI